MTSLIAAAGSGRSDSFIPDSPAAWLVTTIAFNVNLLVLGEPASVDVQVPLAHHFRPLRRLTGDALRQLLGRSAAGLHSERDELLAGFRLRQHPVHLLVELVNDRPGRTRRRHHG